ncbi:MAG: Hg(II)-responsive transcriptional regulator [Betaproteobacteria bacterium]|nr:Hg(II)-responsive transcriptional regulator [Betaproteobacteria bacterium]
MENNLTIGQVAGEAGVHVETVRYYQRIGLIGEPLRPSGGVRRYGGAVVQRLRFVKRAQEIGFSLDEVRQLLALDDGQSCRETRQLAEHKLAVIEQRLADLARIRKTLKALVAECESGKRPRSCPIIATLSAAN